MQNIEIANKKTKILKKLNLKTGGYILTTCHRAENVDKKLVEEFSKVKGKKVLKYNAESDLTDYLQLYTDLAK